MDDRFEQSTVSTLQHQWATKLSGLATFLAGGILLAIVLVVLGLGSFSSDAPAPAFVKQHQAFSLLVGGGLVGLNVLGPILARRRHVRPVLAAAFPVAGYVLFGVLLLLVVAHPSWCPTSLCPAPQIVTNAHGLNDGTLEVYTTAVQSTAYVIPGNPSQYSLDNLPQSIGAQRMDSGIPAYPYRAVIGVHSLLRSGYSIVIERVEVLVEAVPVTPHLLNVFIRGPSTSYQSNVYSVRYHGEDPGAVLTAIYQTVPLGHPVLAPGEADNLDIQVTSSVPADIRYGVRITYRVANESAEHSLTVPDVFEVVFANGSNWHPYQLAHGHLIANK